MKVLLYGRYGEYPKEIEDLVKSFGLKIVASNPDVVITHGGDGTVLGAEKNFPGIPKLILKNSAVCHLCSPLSNEKLLELFVSGKLKTKEYMKLEALVSPNFLNPPLALNDIAIAHKFPNVAIRFQVLEKDLEKESPWKGDSLIDLIGDGVVLATPFGSTGYFYSITKSSFTSGIGLAFNNIHNVNIREKIVDEDDEIKIKIFRGPAVMALDNDPRLFDLPEFTEIIIRKAPQFAYFLSP